MSDSPSFNPDVLEDLIAQTGIDLNKAVEFGRLDEQTVARARSADASMTDVRALAALFQVTPSTFFRRSAPTISAGHFRATLGSREGDPAVAMRALSFAEKVSRFLASVSPATAIHSDRLNEARREMPSQPAAAGLYWRRYLDVSQNVQQSDISVSQFFTYVRSCIERCDIAVLTESFRDKHIKGVAYTDGDGPPVIFINSYHQQKQSRTFTLVHELAHVAYKRSAISNPYNAETSEERRCNQFAASFLMPKELIERVVATKRGAAFDGSDNSCIRWLANKLKVSQEATVIRLEALRYVAKGFWRTWKAQFDDRDYLPSEEETASGSQDGRDEGVIKLAKYGFFIASTLQSQAGEGKRLGVQMYRALRLKPKYVSDYINSSRSQLQSIRNLNALDGVVTK